MRPLQHALHSLIFGLVGLLLFCLLSVMWSSTNNRAQAVTSPSSMDLLSSDSTDSPNVITRAMAGSFSWTNDRIVSLGRALKAPNWAGIAIAKTNRTIAASSKGVFGGVHSGATATGRTIGGVVGYMLRVPSHATHSVMHFSVVGFIRPADDTKLPRINTSATELSTESKQPAAVPTTQTANQTTARPPAPAADEAPIWPIHGRVTTLFGVPEPPYEPIHTGLDISDGHQAGTTPIHPYKSGRVIEAVHSHVQLGNHVVIDHGNGLTSVYGHLASIAVSEGQEVSQDTVLGYEGSTGVSTGPHLHFEIRQNGKAVNPGLYIAGRP